LWSSSKPDRRGGSQDNSKRDGFEKFFVDFEMIAKYSHLLIDALEFRILSAV
jgi:hypothetical protein